MSSLAFWRPSWRSSVIFIACGAWFAASLSAQTHISGNYIGAPISGDIEVDAGVTATFQSGSTFSGTNATFDDTSTFNWDQTGTLNGKVLNFLTSTSGGMNVFSGRTLTLGPTTTAQGAINLVGLLSSTIVNQGLITVNSGDSGYVSGPDITNASGGTMSSTGGGILYLGLGAGYSFINASGGTILADGAASRVSLNNVTNSGTVSATNGGAILYVNTVTTSQLGNVTLASGGQANIEGTLDNTSATLNAPTGGTYSLVAGIIMNGTVNASAVNFTVFGGQLSGVNFLGDLQLSIGANVRLLNNATVSGNFTLADSAYLNFAQNMTLTGKSITLGSGGDRGILTIESGRTVTFAPSTAVTGSVFLSTVGTLINQGVITHTNQTGDIGGGTFTNATGGQLIVDNGSTMYLGLSAGDTITNASGAGITADGAGSILRIDHIVNSGTITASNGGTVQFSGAMTTANLGNIVIATGGQIVLDGTLNNTSATLNAPTGGSYLMVNGFITGGTVANGALSFSPYGSALSGVTLLGDLTLQPNANLSFTNSGGPTTFTGTNLNIGDLGVLTWSQNGSLTGKNITLGGGANYGEIAVPGFALTLGVGTMVTGDVNMFGQSGGSITNSGTITQTYGTGYIYGDGFTNTSGGTVQVTSGATLNLGYSVTDVITNQSGGTISVSGAGSLLYLLNVNDQGSLIAQNGGTAFITGNNNTTAQLGTLTITSGGHIYLNGLLNNNSATLNAPASGSLELNAGEIDGGTVAAGALLFTNSGGTLSNVNLLGNLSIPANSFATFTNGTTFGGTIATLAASAGINWDQIGTLSGKTVSIATGGYVDVQGAGNALTLAPSTSVNGAARIYSDGSAGIVITNQGVITHSTSSGQLYAASFVNSGSIDVTGGTLTLGNGAGFATSNASGGALVLNGGDAYLTSPMTNSGLIDVQTGTLFTQGNLINSSGGQLKGTGQINGAVNVTGGTLLPGNTIGTLTFASSNFLVSGASTLVVDLSGSSADQIQFTSPTTNVDIGSGLLTLNVSLLGAPNPGTFTIMSISGGSNVFTGRFAGLPNSGDTLSATYLSTPYTFSVNYLSNAITLDFTPVPEPNTYALLGGGLLALALMLRRRASR